jgi:hypothetical protein
MTRIGELETLAVTSNRRGVLQLLVTANAVPSSPILVTLVMEAVLPTETSALTRATRRNIPEDGILQKCFLFKRSDNSAHTSLLHKVTVEYCGTLGRFADGPAFQRKHHVRVTVTLRQKGCVDS